jgi:hypothetical protein
MNRLLRVYAALSRLAERPHYFRAEFGHEMQSVFADIMVEAAARGKVALVELLPRELRDVPHRAKKGEDHVRQTRRNKPRACHAG